MKPSPPPGNVESCVASIPGSSLSLSLSVYREFRPLPPPSPYKRAPAPAAPAKGIQWGVRAAYSS